MSITAASGGRASACSSPVEAVGGLVHLVAGSARAGARSMSRRVVVVLDDQHPAPDAAGRPVAARRRAARAGAGRSGKRTVNALPRPGPSLAASMRAAVQIHEPLHQGEPDAEPGRRPVEPGLRPARTGRRSAGRRSAGIPAPVSATRQLGLAVPGLDGDRDPPAGRRELHRVAEEVGEDLLEPGLVGLDPRRLAAGTCRRRRRRGRGQGGSPRAARPPRGPPGAGRA